MPALGAPHSEFLVVGILFFALGVVLLTVARLWPPSFLRRAVPPRPVVTAVWPSPTSPLDEPRLTIDAEPIESASSSEGAQTTHDVAAGVVPTVDAVAPVAPRVPTWPALVDPDADELDQAERSDVLLGLGIVGDRWSTRILAKAFDEETGALRVAAIEAIAMCDGDLVAPMLELAYATPLLDERYAAVDGASRRGDVALLERALRDADGGIALASAYGLHIAHRDDLVEAGLTLRGDAESGEIRRVLAILG